MQFPLPALLCDVGGTNIRVARLEQPGAAPVMVGHAATQSVTDLAEAIAGMDGARGARAMIVCAAGPIIGRAVKLTNASWTLDGPELAGALRLEQGLLLHDFEALALSLPALPPARLKTIGPDLGQPIGARLVLGPGTGLGAAALTTVDGRYLALTGEAGHVEFGPAAPDEAALWPHLAPVHGRITSEAVLSGDGLARLHRARLASLGTEAPPIDPAAVVARATAHAEGPEADTARLFWRLVARFAGDLALIYAARGGVTLAGGVLPRLAGLLDEAAFRTAFEAKAPMTGLMQAMPTRLLTRPETVLSGLAAIATDPDHFVIDYPGRAWRP